jgi:CHASE2 domain-containing sensor protein/tRNA A-37 threonylcarbamoyl transferase component Bud32
MNSRSSIAQSGLSGLWAAGLLILLAIAGSFLSRTSGLENWVYDYFQRYQYKTASDQIVLVTVDSRAEKQKDFWRGQEFGRLISVLDEFGARMIVATQPLSLPEVPDERQIRALEDLQRQASRVASLNRQADPLGGQIAAFRRSYDNRQELLQTLKESGNVLLSAQITSFAIDGSSTKNCASQAVNTNGADAIALRYVQRARYANVPPAKVCDSVHGLGFSNFWPDEDGIFRTADLVINADGVFLPSLALSASVAARGNNSDIVIAADNALTISGQVLRTSRGLQILNRFYAGTLEEPAFNEVTATAVLTGLVDPAAISDRIVMVGESTEASLPGLATPIDAHMSPLMVTASSLSNLLENDFLLRPEWLVWLEFGIMAAVLLLALFWVPAMPAIGTLLMGMVLAMLVLSIEAWLLVSEGIWIRLATTAAYAAAAVWTMHIWRIIAQPRTAAAVQRSPTRETSGYSTLDEMDLEFSVLRQQAPNAETKEKMYEIAIAHGKAKEFARAEKVLIHIAKLDTNYKDVNEILAKLSGARKKRTAIRRKKPASIGSLDRRTLGRYEIDRVLGRGAMATVYLGRDPAINRKVAIKTVALAKEFNEEELQDARLQFQREAESAGRLNHPNIIAIYDVGEDDDVSYLAMEYFEGVSLLEHARPDNLMPPKWVLELCARAAEALDYAHRQNVVHRDIKPANIMYHAATDTLKLTDFGIARLTDNSRTKTGVILGTPSYMSPEQLSASGVTGRSDLYSLGISMYQLLTGNAPFRADSIPKLMDKIMNEDPTPIAQLRKDIPACVDEILQRCMAKDPEIRFTSGREMAMALRDCAKNF